MLCGRFEQFPHTHTKIMTPPWSRKSSLPAADLAGVKIKIIRKLVQYRLKRKLIHFKIHFSYRWRLCEWKQFRKANFTKWACLEEYLKTISHNCTQKLSPVTYWSIRTLYVNLKKILEKNIKQLSFAVFICFVCFESGYKCIFLLFLSKNMSLNFL